MKNERESVLTEQNLSSENSSLVPTNFAPALSLRGFPWLCVNTEGHFFDIFSLCTSQEVRFVCSTSSIIRVARTQLSCKGVG